MKRLSKQFIVSLALFALMLALLTGPASASVSAQDIFFQNASPPLTASQQALLADWQPVQDLAPLSLTPCVGGMAGVYPCHEVDLLAFMPLSAIGGGSGNDIWGWTDPLSGREYAIMGRSNGTAFVDISDPQAPVYLGNLPTSTSSSVWRDMKVYADHVFVVADNVGAHGMQVFDLTELRGAASPPVTFAETTHYSGFGSAHNVVINEESGFAYVVGSSTCNGSLHMIDIRTPAAPVFAGCAGSAYTHDAQCLIYQGPDVEHQGQEICFNSNGNSSDGGRLAILDVTDKSAPVQLASKGYANAGYIHQGWLSRDQVYFFLGDEGDELDNGHNTRTYIWYVADLDNPLLIGNYTASTAAIDHNMYVRGRRIYQANYRAGLRILDAGNVFGIQELAFFDIYPSNDSPAFNGAWSIYPYFDSGVIVGSGIESGLFILEPRLPDFGLTLAADGLAACSAADASTTVDLTARYGYSGQVALAAAGLPAAASADFAPNPVAAPGVSTMTVSLDDAPVGDYLLTVSGSDGILAHDDTLLLTVLEAPAEPALLTPANGAVDQPLSPTFTWAAAAAADAYDLEIAADSEFSSLIHAASGLTDTVYAPEIVLSYSTDYFWRVRAGNACGGGDYAAPFSFTTACYWADLDCGCSVDALDLAAAAANWACGLGQPCYRPEIDRDGSGQVTVSDLMAFAAQWGWSCSS